MGLLGLLLLLFILVPLLELYLLVRMGAWIGVLPTIVIVFATGIVGAALARREGLRTLWEARASLSRGETPGRALLDGLAILVGGALLLTPGLLTDLVGFTLLLPGTRGWIRGWIRRSLERRLRDGSLTVYMSGSGQGWWGGRVGGEGGETDSTRGLDPDKEIEID